MTDDLGRQFGGIILTRKIAPLVLFTLIGTVSHGQQPANEADHSFDELALESLSVIDGSASLPGLREPVTIYRDEFGIPHIYAENTHDLFFAQGYVIAQDRLWQLEMNRHVAQGRISELIGRAGLAHDRLVRTLRYRGPFDDLEWTNYHPDAREILSAYAQGVNAYILQAGRNLPVEFQLTGHRPELWRAEEILTRARIGAAIRSAQRELRLAQQVDTLGAEEANRRAKPDPYGELATKSGVDYSLITESVINSLDGRFLEDFPRPELRAQFASLQLAWKNSAKGAPEMSPGSNNWAIAGELTRSGSALIVDDPHRQVTLPAWRYVVHLKAPGWNVIGATEPGLPGVIRGHNGLVAWGRTATGTDEADVYVETVNPDNPNEFLWNGEWETVKTEVEVIKIKGENPELFTVRIGRHGPVFFQSTEDNVAFSLRSSLQERGTAEYIGALRLNQATGAKDCLEMGRYIKSPPTNLVCADIDGNIAFQVTAAAPSRPNWLGRLPVPGTGAYEWAGLRPSEDLPREYNPDRNYIATANNNIHPEGWERPLFYTRRPPYWRFDRIVEMIQGGKEFDSRDMVAMLLDNYRGSAEEWQPYFLGWTPSDSILRRASDILVNWDRLMDRDSAGAAIFHLLTQKIDVDELRAATFDGASSIVKDKLTLVVNELTEMQGANPDKWRYCPLHQGVFAHALVSAYDLPSVERDGGHTAVNATGSVYRLVTDFSDLDKSLFTLGPGQSGQPGSPHYGDLLDDWSKGEFFPLRYSDLAVKTGAQNTLTLYPTIPAGL